MKMTKIQEMFLLVEEHGIQQNYSYLMYSKGEFDGGMAWQLMALSTDSEAEKLFHSMSMEESAEYYDMCSACIFEGVQND
jgi:hypothetical protein